VAAVIATNPFNDPAQLPLLYEDAGRLARRTSALHRAKTAGRPVAKMITDLAVEHLEQRRDPTVADIGCGRGTSTRALAERLSPAQLVAVDASAAVLASARTRLGDATGCVRLLCADFHHLPLQSASCDLAVAAFCLYHSPRPAEAIAELARCLAPGGVAILVTKSTDSYRALDELTAASGLDPQACHRRSLYESAHSDNLTSLTARSLAVRHVEHEEHRFAFDDLSHVAAYLATSPKYTIPAVLRGDSVALAKALRTRLPEGPVTTTSRVTYVVSVRQGDQP
jgi:ubiquinone/menaquinone biosynthesis C-methylase UbiE